ncbi:hypothetical protein AU255_09665 [Methyloprofundus sedimenti]|uniref:Uncharacterized protein n=1 Tax=Methyloprofundus sedimenti TaxID=1420851 RepID=A0A1V8M9C1_9GAMM|nr:hypothetical protein [Methyloprofundus sedimenti]OQK18092.1 hypothetical protein AU255_09665 [Methyloprofundus sedimenti]
MLRCPSCNARLNERVICSRCRADLTALISAEQAAQQWFTKAVEYYLAANVEQSITALSISLGLNTTRLAIVFREFIIERQCYEILDLLAQKRVLAAKRSLYKVHFLFPYSKQLLHLNLFSDYLLVNRTGGA